MNVTESLTGAEELIGQAANEFFAAIGRGEQPSISEFAARYPAIAEHIRRAFPALLLVGSCSKNGNQQFAPLPDENCRQLGDFRLIREIGRGGMGTVFEAEQISMGRLVALKVLPFAAIVDANSLQRFRNEVRAAAALNHPNIVPVYSVGEERGVHFYAMQLIRGRTLADLISELRADRAPSSRPLADEARIDSAVSTQARLSTVVDSRRDTEVYRSAATLGIQAAQALQHAHDQGVLHRDIKPSNLLLDSAGQLFIVDFGLARIEADAGLTMTGDLLGTLRYMPPEQALAKRVVIDHRADIYSLGISLYELLALQPAFSEKDRSELLKQIAFDEPMPLRKLDRQIPADLDTIVHKAVAKNPADRYQSCQQFADDLGAFLENRPINAKPPTYATRTAKWSQRHWKVLTAAASMLLVIALGSLVSTVALLAERRHTQQAADESKAVVDFLVTDLLAGPQDERKLNRDITVSEVLQSAESRIDSALAEQPLVEATVRMAMARTYLEIDKADMAEKHARRAVEIRTRLLPLSDPATLEATQELQSAVDWAQRRAEARDIAIEAYNTRRDTLGPDHPETVKAMVDYVDAALGLHPDHRTDILSIRADAEECLLKCRRVFGPESPRTLGLMISLARTYSGENPDKSQQLYEECMALARHVHGGDNDEYRVSVEMLADLLEQRGQKARAIEFYREYLKLSEAKYGSRHHITVKAMNRLSAGYLHAGELEQARVLSERAAQIADQDMQDTQAWSIAHEVLALIYIKLGQLNEAQALYEKDIAANSRVFGPTSVETLRVKECLVLALAKANKPVEAHKLADQIIEQAPADEFILRNRVAWALSVVDAPNFRDGPKAVALAKQACKLTGFKNPGALDTLAAAYAESGDFISAMKWGEQAVQHSVYEGDRTKYETHLASFRQKKPWRMDF